jgi:hypothetical protein
LGSIVVATLFTLAGLAVTVWLVVVITRDAARERHGVSPWVRLIRWGVRCLALCCAFTAWAMQAIAWYGILTRHLEAAVEGSLACRLAFYYPACGGAALVWLAHRIPDHWFRPRYRGPGLLPPAPPSAPPSVPPPSDG